MQELFLTAQQAQRLLEVYGSPLYVYSEQILRRCCREMKGLLCAPGSHVSYSVKANTNLSILRIARQEGLYADAMSEGEIALCRMAGFTPQEIFYVCNNVSPAELKNAAQSGLVVSVDSLSQLEMLGRVCPGARTAVRVNTEFGGGHHEKVVTAGKKTKFGVELSLMPQVQEIAARYGLHVVGLNQHIGSDVREPGLYEAASNVLIDTALAFLQLELIDFGGGFWVPYRPEEESLDLQAMRAMFDRLYARLVREHPNGAKISMRAEPGRYVVAECGVLLGTVEAVKQNHGKTYVGTDIGFNVLARPMLYDAYHHIVLPQHDANEPVVPVTVTGNICESGDILAKDRMLAMPHEGDVIAVLTAGAYGYAMSSSYNCRMRPAEVLLTCDGGDTRIRRRETVEDLARMMQV